MSKNRKMTSLINRRVKIIKGRDKDKFGMILETTKTSADGNPAEFLIELNDGKINKYPRDEIIILTEVFRDKEGKISNIGGQNGH